jgi:RNA polymerase sigma-70 factor (ECF subfamily)
MPRSEAARFDALYRAHRDRVHALCLRYGAGSNRWAEDLMQDVFMRLMKQLPMLDRDADIGGWLYVVAGNLAASQLARERSWFNQFIHRLTPTEEPLHPSPQELYENDEEAIRAVEALKQLPGPERVVLTMKVLDGKSQREIAAALSFSEGYVSKLLARAWKNLREQGWELPDE